MLYRFIDLKKTNYTNHVVDYGYKRKYLLKKDWFVMADSNFTTLFGAYYYTGTPVLLCVQFVESILISWTISHRLVRPVIISYMVTLNILNDFLDIFKSVSEFFEKTILAEYEIHV